MANQDWLYRESAPLIVAAKAAGLQGAQKKQVDGLAWITAKHKTLMKMPTDQSRADYAKLDHQTQDALKQWFGEPDYSKAEGNFIDKAVGAVGSVVTIGSNALEKWTDTIGQTWRTVATVGDVGDWSRAWNKAEDGKRVFDQDREAALKKLYDPATFTIAKRLTMGDTIGEILSDMSTPQDYDAMRRMLNGDDNSVQALRDFDQAHISFGRSLAHLLGLDPNAGQKNQGLEGLVFKGISGVADFAYDVALDPMTWMTGGITAYRKATLGILNLDRAAAGQLTKGQSVLASFGKKFSWDDTFANPKVSKLWDDVGAQVKIAKHSKNAKERAVARVRINEISSDMDPGTIDTLVHHNVFDSKSALDFMKNQEGALAIMQGRSGSTDRFLPSYQNTIKVRNGLRNLVHQVTGYAEKSASLDTNVFADGVLETNLLGQSAANSAAAHAVRAKGRMATRMFERAFVDRSIYTAGTEKGSKVSMRSKSAGSVYTLARLVYDKPTARMMSAAFVGAQSEAEARMLVKGLYNTIADKAGATVTEEGRAAVKEILSQWDNAVFAEAGYVSAETAKAAGIEGGKVLKHDVVDGQHVATALYHLKHQMTLPAIADIIKVSASEDARVAWSLGLRNKNRAVTDMWSALNLLPRLGLRSVLDEGLFHALTMPTVVAMNAIRGYQVGTTQRMLTDRGMRGVAQAEGAMQKMQAVRKMKSVGSVARFVLRPIMTTGVTDEAIREAATNPVIAGRLLETQLTKSVMGRALFAGKSGERYAKYAADLVEHGAYEQTRALANGLSAAVSTAEPAIGSAVDEITTTLHKSILADMNANKIRLGGKPTKVERGHAGFLVNSNIQLLNVIDRNGEIGRIAVQFMEEPSKAVDELVAYFKTREGKAIYESMDRSVSKTKGMRENAFDMYVHVRQQLTNDTDIVNDALLAKVRPNGFGNAEGITASNLTIDDMRETADGLRSSVFGFAREMTLFKDLNGMVSEMLNNGFGVMDRQIGTLSREPSTMAYYFHFRDRLAASEQGMVKKLMASGMDKKTAEATAQTRYTNLANNLAVNRVVGFIDNPNVRSNLAFSARNIARYYRANEDFYRRAMRVLREQGAGAMVRLRMANEGLSHAGFIHEDSTGDKYFTFPVDEIMYSAYASTLNLFGVNVMRPMPLALTGKIKMMTPSLDPQSNLPTFAGPLMSISWSVLKNAGFIPEEYRASVTQGLFGQYAEGQSWFDQLIPSTIKRATVAGKASLGLDDEQIASATMKAMAYYAANGMAPTPRDSLAVREEYLRNVKATARSIVFMRNTLGLISPVSPQLSEIQDVHPALLSAGVQPFKVEFQNMVQAEYDKGNTDAWNTAMLKWTKVNPGRLVYTVSQAEADTVATVRKTRLSVEWIQKNRGLAEKYREAAAFLMPQANNFDMDAYAFLKREGFIKAKDVDKYFEEITNVVVENKYYDVKNKYEKLINEDASGARSSYYTAQMNAELSAIKAANPFLSRMFEQRDGTTQLKKDVVGNMSDALNSGLVSRSDTTTRLRKMLDAYNAASSQVGSIVSETDAAAGAKKAIKSQAQENLASIAGSNPNAILFYETILKRLLD